MGNANGGEVPVETFRSIAMEYDRLKAAGLSVEEMHMILQGRLSSIGKSSSFKTESSKKSAGSSEKVLMLKANSGVSSPTARKLGDETAVAEVARQFEAASISRSPSAHPPSHRPSRAYSPRASAVVLSPAVMQAPEFSNGVVLLIDDSPVAAKVASKVLQQLKFEVLTALSARKGYDVLVARFEDVKIVFLDVVMPEVDGVECLQWIKENPEIAHIPVYMLSGLEDNLLLDVCTERGAEGMILKPLNVKTVRGIVKDQNIEMRGVDLKEPEKIKEIKKDEHVDVPKNKPKVAVVSSVAVSSQAPAFKLVDSDLQVYSFPAATGSQRTYFVFLPTIYCSEMYVELGFMSYLFAHSERLTLSGDHIVIITGDLPFPLAAAKKRFRLPFRMISDPSLYVSQRYVGASDIGAVLAVPDEEGEDHSKHPQNSFLGPNLGIVFIDKKRMVLAKWLSSCESKNTTIPNFSAFPLDIMTWGEVSEESEKCVPEATEQGIRLQPTEAKRTPKGSLLAVKEGVGVGKEGGKGEGEKLTAEQVHYNKLLEKALNPENAHKNKVLIVDDSSVSSRVAGRKLESRDFCVTCVYNGQQAFEVVTRHPTLFDVLLVDVVMPVCDGMELLRMLKSEPKLMHLPVIMLSGLDGEELARNCLALGAASLMKKPFDDYQFSQLSAAIFGGDSAKSP